MKKRSLFLGLLTAIVTGCATVTTTPTINKTQQTISDRIYTAEKNSESERHSREKSIESACSNAHNTIAKSIEAEVRSNEIHELSYINGKLEQRIRDFMSIKTDATISGSRIDHVQCDETKTGIFTKTIEYDCSCTISIQESEYNRLVAEHRKNRTLEKETIKIKYGDGTFRMDRQEVSIGDFATYLKMERKNQYKRKCKNTDKWITFTINPEKDLWSKKPMICIDQETAKAYCNYFGKDLPTKEQWEYAAGISNGLSYPWGDEDPTTEPPKTNFGQVNSYKINTTDVDNAAQDISPFGILNMGGNVAEWTKDKEIAKGGAWNQQSEYTRIEHSFKVSKPNTSIGFRCVSNL